MDVLKPVSEWEKLLFEEFKERMADEDEEDDTLIRFLRAREHDLNKAEAMLRASIKWRVESDIESYKSWIPPSVLGEDYSIIFDHTGFDIDGRPVFYIPLGAYLGKEAVEDGWKDDLFKFVFYALEKGLNVLRKSGAATLSAIIDMEHLRMKQIVHVESMMILYRGFGMLEANYPETLKRVYIINAPWLFTLAFNFFKPILSTKTIDKIKIYGCDQEKWLPEVLETLPVQSIPCVKTHNNN